MIFGRAPFPTGLSTTRPAHARVSPAVPDDRRLRPISLAGTAVSVAARMGSAGSPELLRDTQRATPRGESSVESSTRCTGLSVLGRFDGARLMPTRRHLNS